MEDFNCSDSSEMNTRDNLVCSNDFQGMLEGLEDEDNIEEMNCSTGKKKRLTSDQVQALEKIFEVDSKLDQERKIKLAHELGLQPRQVAIWFQNRRARWKTKQLERDYRLLKANYEALQLDYSKVEQEKEGLVAELRGLKEKLGEENTETSRSIKKALSSQSPQSIFPGKCNDSTETQQSYMNHEVYTNMNLSKMKQMKDFKERLSDDSDSSGILNEDSHFNKQPMTSRLASCSAFDGIMDQSAFSFSTSVHHPPSMDSRGAMMKAYQQQQFVMMEEQNFFTQDDSCNLLSIDQTPLFWYFSDQRN